MRIGLHDSDNTGFPNYALMKISAWHKAQGDTVEWWIPIEEYDRVWGLRKNERQNCISQIEPYRTGNTTKNENKEEMKWLPHILVNGAKN